ncbi:protein IN2-1 homolog B-like [Asparagus officinalis]|uniref:protein IN2-1 homolog B-like n=1 Tax=Asparagus officinalis TaxID=4686 RepID=UPI00098E3F52|nr:protein IN2-1 homolog B-like [Asparagus officinalis]
MIEQLPSILDASADPPILFDGTTRLYVSYTCPFAQRTWITRNYKGLQDKIKLVPIDLQNRPNWYKEKLYPENKVPALEHNNEVKGESLDLIHYIDENFEGPKLLPEDPTKQEFATELLSYSDTLNKVNFFAIKSKGDACYEVGAAYDKLEEALAKFDGPFFLGEFSLVDIAYAPFVVERFKPLFSEVKNYDVTKGRPKLTKWIEELNKIDAYTATKHDPTELLGGIKKRLGLNEGPQCPLQKSRI